MVGRLGGHPFPAGSHLTCGWSETGSSWCGSVSGTLTIGATPTHSGGDYYFPITSISGSFTGGTTLNGVAFNDSGTEIHQVNKEVPSFLEFSSSTPSAANFFLTDFAVDVGASQIGLLFTGANSCQMVYKDGDFYDSGGDTFTLGAVPESSLNPSLLAAAGLGFGLWRRRSARAARA